MTERKIRKSIRNFFFHSSNSIRRISNHIRVSVRLFYRSRLTVFLFLFYPIILLLLFGSIFAKQDLLSFDIGIQDNDATPVSQELVFLRFRKLSFPSFLIFFLHDFFYLLVVRWPRWDDVVFFPFFFFFGLLAFFELIVMFFLDMNFFFSDFTCLK